MRPRLPNVVLVLVDTLRGDRLSCYGHGRPTTPILDRLAAESTLYTTVMSPGAWTPPSHASIFTGTYPSRHGVDRSHPYLDGPLTTLPEYLRAHGYRTFGISSNFWISTATGYDRGFDVFCQSWQLLQTRANPALERQRRRDPSYTPATTAVPVADRVRAAVNALEARFWRTCCAPLVPVDMGARRVNRVVKRWIRRWRTLDAPFFAFIHYMEPHEPYTPPTRFLRRHVAPGDVARARGVNQHALKFMSGRVPMGAEEFDLLGRLYDAEVSYTDHCVAEVIDGLRGTGLLDDTLLVVTSDHGENLGEHGLMSHMFSVHEPIVRVPLLVRYPGGAHRGVESALVQTTDLFPTIAALVAAAGAAGNGTRDAVAEQFQAAALPPVGPPREHAFAELLDMQPPLTALRKRYPWFDWSVYDRSLRVVRTPTHKYVQGSDGSEALYAIERDPGETEDRMAAEPDVVAALRVRLAEWQASFTPAAPSDDAPELDAEIRRRLQDLGYLED
jgi:arylsulfatase A-like enzyme